MAVILAVTVVPSGGTPAHGQALPGPSEPGQVEKRFIPPVQPKSTLEPVTPAIPEQPAAPEDAEKFIFTLSGIVVGGSTVYTESDFQPLYAQHLGTEVSLADIYKIAEAITVKYRNDGYILSRAVVPPQRVKNGSVVIRIVEGYVDKVTIEGDRRDRRGLIERYTSKITASRPLRSVDLERYLLLVRDLPGVRAEALLRPAKGVPGAAELVVKVERKPFDVALGFDNRGTRFLGPYEALASVNLNSVLGLGERTTVRYVTTPGNARDRQELNYFRIDQAVPLGSEGTILVVGFSRTLTEPGFTLKTLDVKGRGNKVRVGLRHPFVRSRSRNLYANVSFSYETVRTSLLDTLVSDDRISSMHLSGSYDFVDHYRGVSFVEIGVTQGLDILANSSENSLTLSRERGRSDFTKMNIDFSRLQSLYPKLNLFIAGSAQFSAQRLLSSQEFSVGGGNIGRGYDPSEINGDHGFAVKAEFQYGERVNAAFLDAYQAYTFYDFGAVYQVENSSQESLASTGFGVRFNLSQYVSGYAELAFPLTRPVATRGAKDGNDPRVFFSMTARY